MKDTAKTPKRKGALIRHPLTTLSGLLAESARVYRGMRAGKIKHEEGRSLVWVLAQMRAMVETQHLERLEARLEEIAEATGTVNGHTPPARQAVLTH